MSFISEKAKDQIPRQCIIGKADNQWPVHFFESDSQAINWLEGQVHGEHTRRAWRVHLTIKDELEIVKVPTVLRPKQKVAGS